MLPDLRINYPEGCDYQLWSGRAWMYRLDQGDLEDRASLLRGRVDKFLLEGEADGRLLEDLDLHLTAAAQVVAADRQPRAMVEMLELTLSEAAVGIYLRGFDEVSSVDTGNLSQKELDFSRLVLKAVVGFGLWRAAEEGKLTADHNFEKPVYQVGAVALTRLGEVLAQSHRGEFHRSVHAEHGMIYKLQKNGQVGRVDIVATGIEPCAHRSEKHRDALAGDMRGCSERLVDDVGMPVVAYITGDGGDKGNGRGGSYLSERGILVLVADNQLAQEQVGEANMAFSHLSR